MKANSKMGMGREGVERWRRPLGPGRRGCGLGDPGLGGVVEGRDDFGFRRGGACLRRGPAVTACFCGSPTRTADANLSHGAPLPPALGFPDAWGCHPGTACSKGLQQPALII